MGIFGWSLPPGCGTLPGEESDVFELSVDGVWYAWDDSDRVYMHAPKNPHADECGYVYIGNLEMPQDAEASPECVLRDFVRCKKA